MRYDLDAWARWLDTTDDAAAAAALRSLTAALTDAMDRIRPVYLRVVDAPEEHALDSKRLLDCAIDDCYGVIEHLSEIRARFLNHERGEQ
jgi:hypothetical protein